LWYTKQLSNQAKVLVVNSLLYFGIEWTFAAVGKIYGNNLWMTHIIIYFDVLFVFNFYYWFVQDKLTRTILVSVFSMVLVLITYFNFKAKWVQYTDHEFVVHYFWTFIAVGLYYINTFREEKVTNLFRDLGFMVGFILIISNSIVFLQNILYNTFQTSELSLSFIAFWTNVNWGTIIFYNLSYGTLLWVTRRPRN
jgi:hypothetical protein